MKRSYLPFYLLMITLSLFLTVAVSVYAHLGTLPTYFFTQFLINLPFCLLFGLFDGYIIRHNPMTRHSLRVATDLLSTTTLALFASTLINYGAGEATTLQEAVRDSILVVSWNMLVILQLEIFHFHQKAMQMEKEKSAYQFEVLKNQLQPHFLFNSLNVLSSLAYQDPSKANLFAKKLSNLYRYILLTKERPTVTLEEELSMVESYLYLIQIRFKESLQIQKFIDNEQLHQSIIPLCIQLLIENAIMHNSCTQQMPLAIRINIDSSGITVSNPLQLRSSVASHGTGLKNLSKQYAHYNQQIEIQKTETTFKVHLPFITV